MQLIEDKKTLTDQFSKFENDYKKDFDESGWELLKEKITEYVNDLHVNTLREFTERENNSPVIIFSRKDIERASMRLDFQRLYTQKKKGFFLQFSALAIGLITGILANWAFTSLSSENPPALPWISLIIGCGLTIGLSAASLIKNMEP